MIGDHGMSDAGITLGEVGRGVEALRGEVNKLREDVTELKVKTGTQIEKTDRLERIVYGALGTALAALLTAIIGAVLVGVR